MLVLAFVGAALAYPGGHAESYASVIQHSVPIAIHHEPIKHEEHHELLRRETLDELLARDVAANDLDARDAGTTRR